MVADNQAKFLRWLQKRLGNLALLKWLERKVRVSDCGMIPPPIFIVGAPRVGSTLFFQALIAKYELAYLSNLHALLFSQPCLADRLAKVLKSCGYDYRHKLESRFGYTPGLLGPSEAGATFRHWFGEADFSLVGHRTDCRQIRLAIATLSASAGGPFISKNLFNSMRLKEILKCFPEAFLVWMRRDHESTAKSILAMRRRIHGTDKRWVSVKIPGLNEVMKLTPKEQVLRQILAVESYLEERFLQHGQGKTMIVNYDLFCLNPESWIDKLMTRYSRVCQCKVSVRKTFDQSIFAGVKKR